VYELYKSYARPLVRVVQGLPTSWESIPTTVRHHNPENEAAVWSPCGRFVAVAQAETIEILDAVTLVRLRTFTHTPAEKTRWLSFSPGSYSLTQFSHGDNLLTTWDLQTGGRISVIPSTPDTSSSRYFSSAYSVDGKVIAVAYIDSGSTTDTTVTGISTYNLLSGIHIYSHPVSEGRIVAPIWTHGECLRFVTVKPRSITIWEVGFTSIHTLAEIESLPAPDDVGSEESLFLPTRSRFAFILRETILVWDSQDSKLLLNFMGDKRPRGISFSSDGRFLACGTIGQEINLWKDSPTGYVLHRQLVSSIDKEKASWFFPKEDTIPLLSPNGESIITSKYSETQLWRTTDPAIPPSSVPTQPTERTEFVLGFSPDKSFIAIARLGDNIATILDLKSGDPRLIIDTSTKICCLGVTGSIVIVVGDGKIITWDLPAGDRVLDARADVNDNVRTVMFNHPAPPPTQLHAASISPDFSHVVITRGEGECLDIYDISTGKHLVGTNAQDGYGIPWFTQDGRELWSARDLPVEGWNIIRNENSDVIGLDPFDSESDVYPSGGYPWISSDDHYVTDSGWIFNSRKKRLMWLPHRWRKFERYWIWNGQFLGLLDPGLSEPVILELEE
jgi:hypothetical protein